MNKTQRIEIGSIEEIIERLQVAQKFGYKNLYLELDLRTRTTEESDEDWDEDRDGRYMIKIIEKTYTDEVERFTIDCDNMFTVKTMYQ